MVSGTARYGKGVRREAESEGSRIPRAGGPTNRNRIPGWRAGLASARSRRPILTRTHDNRSGGHPVTQSSLTLGDLSFREVELRTAGAPSRHGAGEVSRGHSSLLVRVWRHTGEVQPCLVRANEGLNLTCQGAVGADSMGRKRQQVSPSQPPLLGQAAGLCPGESGAGRTQAGSFEESQASATSEPARALTDR